MNAKNKILQRKQIEMKCQINEHASLLIFDIPQCVRVSEAILRVFLNVVHLNFGLHFDRFHKQI